MLLSHINKNKIKGEFLIMNVVAMRPLQPFFLKSKFVFVIAVEEL